MATQARIRANHIDIRKMAKRDRVDIKQDFIDASQNTDLDNTIIAYGPVYETFRNSKNFSLSGIAGNWRISYLRNLNL